MLSVARLRPSSVIRGYYERAARTDADWAAWTGTPVSEWVGGARVALGCEGPVGPGELTRVLLGSHPMSGRVLRRTAPGRTVVRVHRDPRTGQTATRQDAVRPVAGFDLVFSAPKSISLMLAIAVEEARGIAAAHRTAWRDALAFLESHACVVRRAGMSVTAAGYIGAAYAHYTNRDGDPHLHTHVVVANQTLALDDPTRWRALDGIPILVGWRRAARAIYEARLRHELTTRFGVAWHRLPGGGIELAAIGRDACVAASRRSAAVREHADRHRVTTAHGARVASHAARPPRRDFMCAERREAWQDQAAEYGLDDGVRREIFGVGRRPTSWPDPEPDPDLLGARGLTATAQTFTHADLVVAIADAALDGAISTQIWARAELTAALAIVTRLAEPRTGRPVRYTTDEILRVESTVIRRAEAGRGRARDRATPEDIASAIAFGPRALSDEQIEAAEHAAAPSDRIACIVGRAGSGKTTALAAAAQALWASGVPVTGSAPSAQAAHVLEQATGVPSATMHALCARWEAGTAVPAGCIIVDEASMADSRTLGRLLAATEHRARVVLVGDDRQLPAVGPGGVFAELVARLGAVALVANHRQSAAWEREALVLLRTGRTDDALARWDAHDRVHTGPDPVGRCAAAWWRERSGASGAESVMLAYRRHDVADLNARAVTVLEAAGLRGKRLGTGHATFAVGDCIRCRINDPGTGLRNGLRGRIAAVDTTRGTITLDAADGIRVEVPRDYHRAGGLEHAWALTGHSAQGVTVDRAFVLAPGPGAHAEWGYVALSRARDAVHLFLDDGPDADAVAELAISLRTRAARPPAVIELCALRERTPERAPGPDTSSPHGDARERAYHHKAALTRALIVER
jgi:conjugative relaxase-like TrwC/TraI family protein